jgi:hypothetical protein
MLTHLFAKFALKQMGKLILKHVKFFCYLGLLIYYMKHPCRVTGNLEA